MATHDQLAHALWPAGAPPTSAKVIQGCVSRLRGLLGADAITTLDHGYRVETNVVTDADGFTQRVARGRELLELGQADRAAYALDEALREWGGDPYVEIAHWGPAQAASAQLQEEKALAEELHVDALLASGDVTRALPVAGTLVAQAPFREHRWAQLAIANYRAGNQAEALEVLRACRATLRDELGVDPGDEITRLEGAVLRQELDPGGPTRERTWRTLSVRGPGWRRTGLTTRTSSSAGTPSSRQRSLSLRSAACSPSSDRPVSGSRRSWAPGSSPPCAPGAGPWISSCRQQRSP